MCARQQDAIAAFRVEAVGIGLFAGALTRMFRKRKSLEKYGCKFHDGEFWNVTPCTVTFLQ